MLIIQNTIEKVINILVFLKLYIVFSYTKILINFHDLF